MRELYLGSVSEHAVVGRESFLLLSMDAAVGPTSSNHYAHVFASGVLTLAEDGLPTKKKNLMYTGVYAYGRFSGVCSVCSRLKLLPQKEGVTVWRLSSNGGKVVVKTHSCQTKFPRVSFIKSVSFILVPLQPNSQELRSF